MVRRTRTRVATNPPVVLNGIPLGSSGWPWAGSDSHGYIAGSITRMSVQLSSYLRPFSFLFVPRPCFQDASPQAVAPWFLWFCIQSFLPLFSLSIGFPDQPAYWYIFLPPMWSVSWAIYPDALTLSLATLTIFLWGTPFLGFYTCALPPFFTYFTVVGALGSSGSSTPHTIYRFAGCNVLFACLSSLSFPFVYK